MGASTFVFRLSLRLPSAELITWVVSSRLLCFAAGEQNSLPLTLLQAQPFPPMTQQGERDAVHACPQRLGTGQGHGAARGVSKPSRDESVVGIDFLCGLFTDTGFLHARSTPRTFQTSFHLAYGFTPDCSGTRLTCKTHVGMARGRVQKV